MANKKEVQERVAIAGPEIRQVLSLPDYRDRLLELFDDLHPYDIFTLIDGLPYEDIAKIISALGKRGIEVFEYFPDEEKKEIFYCFSKRKMVDLLEDMAPDDRADFLKKLPESLLDDILPLVAQAERNDIRRLLQYKERTAGALMTTEYANILPDMTVEEALNYLRKIAPDRETIYYVYVTDKNRKLLGLVTLRELIVARKMARIEDIMHRDLIKVNVNEPAEEVAKKVSNYDFIAIPVVDDEDRLVGIVTVDDVIDVIEEEDTEDMFALGASGVVHDYTQETTWGIAKKRITWLLVLVFVQFISGAVLQMNSAQLQAMIALAFFLPVLSGMGGNAGSQSATTIVRGLATGEVLIEDFWKIFFKELKIGLLVGGVLGTIGFVRAWFIQHDFRLGVTVFLSMIATVTAATTAGAVLPVIFKRIGLDPALMSGPFIASIVDIVSILIYFQIARLVIGL